MVTKGKYKNKKIKRNSISVKEDEDEKDNSAGKKSIPNQIHKTKTKYKHKHKTKPKVRHKTNHKAKKKLSKEEKQSIKAEKYIMKMKEFTDQKKKARNEMRKQKIIKACKTGFGLLLIGVEIILLCL